ncbi:MAG: hypothetical protein R3318_05485 [Gammaproteobacteria bacterium]|nr:hypothetical protein [Gammaproteobacteria bacterium]
MTNPARLIMAICLLINMSTVPANGALQDAEFYFQQGLQAYEADDYETAVTSLEKATEMDQSRSEYFHYLGKSYGKLAQESNWFRAMDLSQKTLVALKQAVQLDENNDRAVIDLIKFYRQAPAFLGGDEKKAAELEKRLAGKTGGGLQDTVQQ